MRSYRCWTAKSSAVRETTDDVDLTLDKAVSVARQTEAVKLQQAIVRGPSAFKRKDWSKQKPDRFQDQRTARASKPDQRGKVCFRCGKDHLTPTYMLEIQFVISVNQKVTLRLYIIT